MRIFTRFVAGFAAGIALTVGLIQSRASTRRILARVDKAGYPYDYTNPREGVK